MSMCMKLWTRKREKDGTQRKIEKSWSGWGPDGGGGSGLCPTGGVGVKKNLKMKKMQGAFPLFSGEPVINTSVFFVLLCRVTVIRV